MIAYVILDESEELVLMTIEALIQLAAGNAGVNVANVGIAISSFAILTAVAYPIANSRWARIFIPRSCFAETGYKKSARAVNSALIHAQLS